MENKRLVQIIKKIENLQTELAKLKDRIYNCNSESDLLECERDMDLIMNSIVYLDSLYQENISTTS